MFVALLGLVVPSFATNLASVLYACTFMYG